ncbi:MAG: ABC transporter ATP-binding protein [Oscillospiraceae bacterium]
MIRLDNITIAYDGVTVLKNLTLHIPRGAHIALMGPSGCGKTSVLNLAAGLLTPASGTVNTTAARIACVFQEPRLLPTRTALQNVNAVLSDKKATLPEAARWLAAAGLSDAMDKYPAELSGGMAQRVSIARALAYDAELLLLDEPFKGLDAARKTELIALIAAHTKHKTLLLATHDRAEADALCSTVLTFQNGTFA